MSAASVAPHRAPHRAPMGFGPAQFLAGVGLTVVYFTALLTAVVLPFLGFILTTVVFDGRYDAGPATDGPTAASVTVLGGVFSSALFVFLLLLIAAVIASIVAVLIGVPLDLGVATLLRRVRAWPVHFVAHLFVGGLTASIFIALFLAGNGGLNWGTFNNPIAWFLVAITALSSAGSWATIWSASVFLDRRRARGAI